MKKIYILAAVTLALTACDNNDDNTLPSQLEAQISATIGGSVLSRASDNSWAAGDQIGITSTIGGVVREFINLAYTTIDGNEKFTGTPIYFHKPMSLTAYYPFTGSEGTAAGIIEAATTAENQTKEKQSKIDFLYAGQTNVSVTDPNVKFNFEHKMSKLTLIFKKGNDGADISKITSYQITGLILQGTFDTANGVCAVMNGASAENLEIALDNLTVTDGVAQAPSLIIFPQTIAGGKVRLKITDSEQQDYACDLTFGDGVIAPGNNYLYTITVSKTGVSIDNPSITDWASKDLESEAKSED